MSRVFVSHAKEDKVPRVRTLVEALLHERFSLWVDRPGMGEANLGLPDDVIQRHDVRGLVSGRPWDDQILEAHRSCAVVLACFSRALAKERQVLVHELVLARYAHKLVACIVDDLPFAAIPDDLGLAAASLVQAPRINTATLQQALDLLRSGKRVEEVPAPLRTEWEVFLRLAADLRTMMREQGANPVTAQEMDAIRTQLKQFGHAPMVSFFEVPQAIIDLLSDQFNSPSLARGHFRLAMQLVVEARDPGDTLQQVAVGAGEVPAPEHTSALDFWSHVVSIAGSKSRRTIAALLLAPHALGPDKLPPESAQLVRDFLAWLGKPDLHPNPTLRSD